MSKKQTVTIGQIIYKGSYNLLVAMAETKKVTLPENYRDLVKVKNQLEIFNKQKPFMSIVVKDKDDGFVFEKLTTIEGKANFLKLLSIAKKVFEPVCSW
jgi:hypothetical protein